MGYLATAVPAPSMWPLVVLGIGVSFVVAAIAVFRVHAFVALILAALLVGALSATLPELPNRPGAPHVVRAIEWTTTEFGRTVGGIGLLIALAAIIGLCLMESGAADKIVRRLIGALGERNTAIALLISGFFLSIPVFFDTVFFLLIPLARALGLRTGRNYVLYVMAICGGGVITHSVVPPTPGPLLVIDVLQVDLGLAMVVGLGAGVLPAVGVLYLARFLEARSPIPLRETDGASLEELNTVISKREDELPPLWFAVLPVLLPVFLIATASFFAMAATELPGVVAAFGGTERFHAIAGWLEFLGNRNIALLIGAIVALVLLARQKGVGLSEIGSAMGPPLETAGVIILITGAGGAFGAMIRYSGVGPVIQELAEGRGISYILLAWGVTAFIRVAQGSATVAMITGAGLMASVIGDGAMLPFHPVYIFLAIAFGSIMLSWMNDSGFWVVGRLSGFTERETLRTWTVMVSFVSLVGLIQTLILSAIFPLVGSG